MSQQEVNRELREAAKAHRERMKPLLLAWLHAERNERGCEPFAAFESGEILAELLAGEFREWMREVNSEWVGEQE